MIVLIPLTKISCGEKRKEALDMDLHPLIGSFCVQLLPIHALFIINTFKLKKVSHIHGLCCEGCIRRVDRTAQLADGYNDEQCTKSLF